MDAAGRVRASFGLMCLRAFKGVWTGAWITRGLGRARRWIAALAGWLWTASAPAAEALQTKEVARGLERPWAVAFLPDGRFLVAERPKRLLRLRPGP
ncbi:hypothetical protein Talka_00018 [Tepidimonas alkaliphilus]|uniref:Glucose/Sorbosone dehydrogenase domain-containing protein n=1 Tax=Tepidimonas alkaliphilus TaxID=2588942 RepID=A0A554WCP3_9BURK|nr:hypothetical protein Talka_00018 [Tepidimonas alkaliphilus]